MGKQLLNIKKQIVSMILVISIICSTVLVGLITYAQQTTDNLSKEMIRFHVVANSDTVADQLLKQKVRDAVIGYVEPLTKNSTSLEETRQCLALNLEQIKNVAEEVIESEGSDYEICIALDKAHFPTKSYGDIILPAGEYEACRIIIGEGKGENWWCVMYPPLCYLDVATGVVPLEGKEQLEQQLSEEQYELLQEDKSTSYQVRFK